MTSTNTQVRVAVLGAGAVGSYFGGMLARSGVQVTLIGRAAHVEAIRANKLFLDTVSFQERVAVNASTETSAVRDADVVLFCVKTTDTEDAARSLKPYLAPRRGRRQFAEWRGQHSSDSRRFWSGSAGCGGIHRSSNARARPHKTFWWRKFGGG